MGHTTLRDGAEQRSEASEQDWDEFEVKKFGRQTSIRHQNHRSRIHYLSQ